VLYSSVLFFCPEPDDVATGPKQVSVKNIIKKCPRRAQMRTLLIIVALFSFCNNVLATEPKTDLKCMPPSSDGSVVCHIRSNDGFNCEYVQACLDGWYKSLKKGQVCHGAIVCKPNKK
jgi:hypothetical protein